MEESRHEASMAVLLEQARHLAEWHWRAAESVERKASTLLGLVGAALALLAGLAVGRSDGALAHAGWLAGAPLLAGVVLLVAAAVALLGALRSRRFWSPGVAQLEQLKCQQEQAVADDVHGHSAGELAGTFAGQWVAPSGDESSTLAQLRADARVRHQWFKAGGALLVAALLMLAVSVIVGVVGGGV